VSEEHTVETAGLIELSLDGNKPSLLCNDGRL
jgi:hypothetical protein